MSSTQTNQKELDKLACEVKESDGKLIKFEDDLDANDVVSHLNEVGFEATLIDRAPVYDKDTLLHALYQSLALPGHFGFNWDALKDVLTDLEQKNGSDGQILVFHDVSQLGDLLETLCEVLEDANEVLKSHDQAPLGIVVAKA